jgi:hypothetical protein
MPGMDDARDCTRTLLADQAGRGGLGSNAGNVMWDLRWTELHLGRFSSITSVSPVKHYTDCSALTTIRGWYNRPNSGRRTNWTQCHLTQENCCGRNFA